MEAVLPYNTTLDKLDELFVSFDGTVVFARKVWSKSLCHVTVVPERDVIVGFILAVDETLDGVATVVQDESRFFGH
jgi:hypothetical protein